MCRTNSYSKQWWYQLVGGTLYSKWWLNNLYVWVHINNLRGSNLKSWLRLYEFIHPGSLKSIVRVWMRQVEMFWCEFDQTKKNYDKVALQEAVMEEKKTICQDTSSHPSSGTLGKVSEWRSVTLDLWVPATQNGDSMMTRNKNLAIHKTYTNYYNCDRN